jgi:2-dehydropantoate 2-reductase
MKTPATNPRIAIIGAGAMGCLLAHYLSSAAEVWLIDTWQAQVLAITRDGLRCELDGAVSQSRPFATSDPAAVGRCDAVLVLVKAHQTAWAADVARTLLRSPSPIDAQGARLQKNPPPPLADTPSSAADRRSTLIVTLQNGVGNREALADTLGDAQVGQAVTSLGATLLGPGKVRHAGMGPTIFGALPAHPFTPRLVDLFSQSGLPAELSSDLATLVWGKLVVNVGINAITALLRIPNGALAEVAAARALVEPLVAEAVAVAEALGIVLPYPNPLAHVLAVAQATTANRSSMLQDVLRSSPTEIETINGAVVREGERLGIATPANAMLTALVRALDATAGQRIV